MRNFILFIAMLLLTGSIADAKSTNVYHISGHINMSIIGENVILTMTDTYTHDENNNIYAINLGEIEYSLKLVNDMYNCLESFEDGITHTFNCGGNLIEMTMHKDSYGVECFYIYHTGESYTLDKSNLRKIEKRIVKHINKK